jgi:hypothetical protein
VADPEHGDRTRDGVAQQGRLQTQRRVVLDAQHRLLTTERHDPVDRVEVGERVAAAHVALVDQEAGLAQHRDGVAAEWALEVVQDRDNRHYALLDRSQMLMPDSTA